MNEKVNWTYFTCRQCGQFADAHMVSDQAAHQLCSECYQRNVKLSGLCKTCIKRRWCGSEYLYPKCYWPEAPTTEVLRRLQRAYCNECQALAEMFGFTLCSYESAKFCPEHRAFNLLLAALRP